MFHRLEKAEFGKAGSLFRAMDYHLAPQAIVGGAAPGTIYVDDPFEPKSAVARTGHRFYLAGFERNAPFNEGLRRLFVEEVYPRALEAGDDAFVLYYSSDGWQSEIEEMLRDRFPMRVQRQYYAFRRGQRGWRELIPPGFTVKPVDGELLKARGLKNLDALREEMVSECPSVAYFLGNRFGFCLAGSDELAGWCLSEYNWRDRCEVGIETVEGYRRRGVATVTAGALIEHALSQGITEIGWHCYTSNEGSKATARKVGLEKVKDYAAYFAWFDEVANLAVNGNIRFQQTRYREAIEWYDRAFQAGEAPAWAYWNAACANSLAGERDAALRYLGQAIERGFTDVAHIKASQHLRGLHETPEWLALIGELEGKAAGTTPPR